MARAVPGSRNLFANDSTMGEETVTSSHGDILGPPEKALVVQESRQFLRNPQISFEIPGPVESK
jgi:hypothetical protein